MKGEKAPMVGYKSFLPPLSVQEKIIDKGKTRIPAQPFTTVTPRQTRQAGIISRVKKKSASVGQKSKVFNPMAQYFSKEAQEMRRAQIDTFFQKQDKQLNSTVSNIMTEGSKRQLFSREMHRFYEEVANEKPLTQRIQSRDISIYDEDMPVFMPKPSKIKASIARITEDQYQRQSKLQSSYSHEAAHQLLSTEGSGFYQDQHSKIYSPPPKELVLDPSKVKSRFNQVSKPDGFVLNRKPYVSTKHRPTLSEIVAPLLQGKLEGRIDTQSSGLRTPASLNHSFESTLQRYQKDYNRLKGALGTGAVMEGDSKRLYNDFMNKKRKERELEKERITNTMRQTSLKFSPTLLDQEMTEEVLDRVHSIIDQPRSVSPKPKASTMEIINEQEEPMKLLPEHELVKMNTKFKGRMGVQESPIPMQALFNRNLNKVRQDQDKSLVLKAPVTIYFDELRHQQQIQRGHSDTNKLRLLIDGEQDIKVDLSKKKERKLFSALKRNSPTLGAPGQEIRRQTILLDPKLASSVERKDSFAQKIVKSSIKFTDDIEKKIYNALAMESSRYGKMMKDFFKQTIEGGMDVNLGDIRKGESVIEELRTKIPRSKLSEMNIKEPALNKYLDLPRISESAKKEEKFNSKWYIDPLKWNQSEKKGRRAETVEVQPKKIKQNNILGRILNDVEQSRDVWEKVSSVERKIKDVTQSRDTRLRDNLVDFMFK